MSFNRVSLRMALIAVTAVAILLTYYREPLLRFVRINLDREPLVLISDEAELRAAMSKEYAVIFFNADWSANSTFNRIVVEEFARERRRSNFFPRIDFS